MKWHGWPHPPRTRFDVVADLAFDAIVVAVVLLLCRWLA